MKERLREKEGKKKWDHRCRTNRSQAKRGMHLHYRGRSPGSQLIAFWQPSRYPNPNSGSTCQSARWLQWRDRAGISPASLFTRRLKASTSNRWNTSKLSKKKNRCQSFSNHKTAYLELRASPIPARK